MKKKNMEEVLKEMSGMLDLPLIEKATATNSTIGRSISLAIDKTEKEFKKKLGKLREEEFMDKMGIVVNIHQKCSELVRKAKKQTAQKIFDEIDKIYFDIAFGEGKLRRIRKLRKKWCK